MRRLAVGALLFVFWVVLSGHFDPLHLILGLGCSALVAGLSSDLLLSDTPEPRLLAKTWRFLAYVPWLIYQIVLANFHVVSLVWRPERIRPQVVRFKTHLTNDLAKVSLGNSITLTPGTITMDIENDEFTVHAVSPEAARTVQDRVMERRIAHVFLDTADDHRAPMSSE